MKRAITTTAILFATFLALASALRYYSLPGVAYSEMLGMQIFGLVLTILYTVFLYREKRNFFILLFIPVAAFYFFIQVSQANYYFPNMLSKSLYTWISVIVFLLIFLVYEGFVRKQLSFHSKILTLVLIGVLSHMQVLMIGVGDKRAHKLNQYRLEQNQRIYEALSGANTAMYAAFPDSINLSPLRDSTRNMLLFIDDFMNRFSKSIVSRDTAIYKPYRSSHHASSETARFLSKQFKSLFARLEAYYAFLSGIQMGSPQVDEDLFKINVIDFYGESGWYNALVFSPPDAVLADFELLKVRIRVNENAILRANKH